MKPTKTVAFLIAIAAITPSIAHHNEDPIDSVLKGAILAVFVYGLYLAWKGAALVVSKLRGY